MEYKTAKDKELWELCRSLSDEKAYAELFRRHFSRMLDVASSRIKDSAKAEELVMDCFFNLWDKRDRTIIEGDFLSYLFKCIRYSIISYFRKEIPEIIGLEHTEVVGSEAADSHLIAEDIQKAYHAALERLTPRRREAFLMRREDNLSYAEIARRMSISVSAVDNYMTSALGCLRTNMKGILSVLSFVFVSVF